MQRYACPICGDPQAFPLWVSPGPPEGCPEDMDNWGTPQAVRNVSECAFQRARAEQAALFRRLVPDAFDEAGAMKKGHLARVLDAFAKANTGRKLVMGGW